MPRFPTMVLLTLWSLWTPYFGCLWSKALTAIHKVTFMCPIKTYSICVIAQCTYTDKNAERRFILCCMFRTSTCHMHGVLHHNITFIQVSTCSLQFLLFYMAIAELWRTRKAMQHWNIKSNSLGTRLASAFHVRHSSTIAVEYISPTSSSREARCYIALHMKSLKMGFLFSKLVIYRYPTIGKSGRVWGFR